MIFLGFLRRIIEKKGIFGDFFGIFRVFEDFGENVVE